MAENDFDTLQNAIMNSSVGVEGREGLASDIEIINPQSSLTDFENNQIVGSSTNFSELVGNSEQNINNVNQQIEEQEHPQVNINENNNEISAQNNNQNIENSQLVNNSIINQFQNLQISENESNSPVENNLGNYEQNEQNNENVFAPQMEINNQKEKAMSISDQNSNGDNSLNNNPQNDGINNLNVDFNDNNASPNEQQGLNEENNINNNNQNINHNSLHQGGINDNQDNPNDLIFDGNLGDDFMTDFNEQNIFGFGNGNPEFRQNLDNFIDENGDILKDYKSPESNKKPSKKS
jgi:hypothetical protein